MMKRKRSCWMKKKNLQSGVSFFFRSSAFWSLPLCREAFDSFCLHISHWKVSAQMAPQWAYSHVGTFCSSFWQLLLRFSSSHTPMFMMNVQWKHRLSSFGRTWSCQKFESSFSVRLWWKKLDSPWRRSRCFVPFWTFKLV